jgi:hypothetical protein
MPVCALQAGFLMTWEARMTNPLPNVQRIWRLVGDEAA